MKILPICLHVARLAGLVWFVWILAITGSYGQGTIGFSSQTQPSVVLETQVLRRSVFVKYHNQPPTDRTIPAEAKRVTYVQTVTDTSMAIADVTHLLTQFDDLKTQSESRRNLGSWQLGIVSDGDFNKTIGSVVTTSKTGSLGIDAVRMKPVYTHYTYYVYDRTFTPAASLTGQQKEYQKRHHATDSLEGYQTVSRPRLALNALVVLFSGSPSLSTGVGPGPLPTTGPSPTATLAQQRVFGQALLVPNGYVVGNGLSFTSNATWYLGAFGPAGAAQNNTGESGRWGVSANLTAVQTNWSSRDTTTVINIVAPSLGLVYRAAEGQLRVGEQTNYAQLQPFVRYTMRHIFGDVQGNTRVLYEALGTRQRSYHALDFGMTLSINAVRLTTNFPIFFGPKIEGFSRGQVIAGFGLAATIPVAR